MFLALTTGEPQNLELKRDLGNAWWALGFVLGEAKQKNRAIEAERKALAIYEELGRADPTSAENALSIALARSRMQELENNP
jgi:hypothetical protein